MGLHLGVGMDDRREMRTVISMDLRMEKSLEKPIWLGPRKGYPKEHHWANPMDLTNSLEHERQTGPKMGIPTRKVVPMVTRMALNLVR